MLEVTGVDVFYGDAQALWDVSMRIEKEEMVTLLGSNGAGKTTTVKTISGLLRPRKGSVHFCGERIDHIPAYEIVRMGVSHVPEGRRLFPNMTVAENLTVGAFIPKAWGRRAEVLKQVFSLFPILAERRYQLAGTLSGGEQQMLTIGRGLMIQPRLMMLDEPSLGLAPLIVNQIFRIIQDINHHGVTILLIEQNANVALQVAKRGYVLETGRVQFQGSTPNLLGNDYIKRAYLGL